MKKEFVKKTAYQLGADVCGIADLGRFNEAPKGFNPINILPETKSVIVFGKQFLKSVFRAKSNVPYTLIRNQLIEELDDISVGLSREIEGEGFAAVPIPSSEPYEYWDPRKTHGRGILSLKHSAQLAGLGYIGKNTLLINPKFGNRLWLGAVITDMDLEPDEYKKDYCPKSCSICIDSCPQSALNEITIDQEKCREVSYTSTEGGGLVITCFLCRKECPHSRVNISEK